MTRNNGIISYLNDLDRQLGALQRLDRPTSAGITVTYSGTPTAGAVAYWTGPGTVAHASFGTADVALLGGRGGGQTLKGGTGSGEDLTLMSTNHATKGQIFFGSSVYNEVNNRLGINTTSPLFAVHVDEGTFYVTSTANDIGVYMTALDGNYGLFQAVDEANSTPKNLVLQGYGGNLGIGVLVPQAKLSVLQATLGSEVLRLESTATNDDTRESVYQNRVATTNATTTTIHTFTVPASTTMAIEINVIGRRTGGTAGTAEDSYFRKFLITLKNVAGTATQVGTTNIGIHNDGGWGGATTNLTGATLQLQVTGAANNNVTWHMTARVWTVSS